MAEDGLAKISRHRIPKAEGAQRGQRWDRGTYKSEQTYAKKNGICGSANKNVGKLSL